MDCCGFEAILAYRVRVSLKTYFEKIKNKTKVREKRQGFVVCFFAIVEIEPRALHFLGGTLL